MEGLSVEPLCVAAFRADPASGELLRLYGEECALAGLPAPCPDYDTYAVMEQSGALRLIGARYAGALIGFCCLLAYRNPHYSQQLAVTESLFVAAPYRNTGAGLALLREAERLAREAGALALFVSAPAGGALQRVLSAHREWRHSNVAFVRGLR